MGDVPECGHNRPLSYGWAHLVLGEARLEVL